MFNMNRVDGGAKSTIYDWTDIRPLDTAILRFLPDKDAENPYFWHELPGKKYIMQGFVRVSPFEEDPTENPIRIFVFDQRIIRCIQYWLVDPDVEHFPTDYEHGSNFRLKRDLDRQYTYDDDTSASCADYNFNFEYSSFSIRSTPLSEYECNAIEMWPLNDLSKVELPVPETETETLRRLFRDAREKNERKTIESLNKVRKVMPTPYEGPGISPFSGPKEPIKNTANDILVKLRQRTRVDIKNIIEEESKTHVSDYVEQCRTDNENDCECI